MLSITKEIDDATDCRSHVCCKITLSAKNLAKGVAIAIAYILLFIMLITLMKSYLVKHRGRDYYVNRYLEENYNINHIYGEEYSLRNNIDVVKDIRKNDCWNDLNYEERCHVMEILTFCEAKRLGIPYELTVSFSNEMPKDIYGTYNYSTRSILYNNNLVMQENSENTIFVVSHEVFHAYQHSLIEIVRKLTPEQRGLKCFEGVDKWAENEFYYVTGNTDEELGEYYLQPLECDATKYAYDNIPVIYSEIDEWVCMESD